MLKSRWGDETWLVQQPDHAVVSGFLAAHWGNQQFARPGYFAPAKFPEMLRQQVVQAIAEHDNGWWEWEASPEIDPADGLPLNLLDVAVNDEDAGLRRWQLGVPRLMEQHPYAALLISSHAYWLHAFSDNTIADTNDALRHPLFGDGSSDRLVAVRASTHEFLLQQRELQDRLVAQLQADEAMSAAVTPEHLLPHVRLLQLMDALSLSLSFGARRELTLRDIPRQSWTDRVELHWKPLSQRRIMCDPYPFDLDPLEVFLPLRIVAQANSQAQELPLVRLHSTPLRTIRFELCGPR